MKKRYISLTAAVALILGLAFAANAAVGEYTVPLTDGRALLGDFDRDGKITSTDARCVLQVAVGKYNGSTGPEDLSADGFLLADVDGDEKITTTDARLILQAAVGKITLFPGEKPEEQSAPIRPATRSNEPVEDLAAATQAVVNPTPDTFMNPVNVAYAYRDDDKEGYREGADPVIQVYRGEYYLFVSHCEGYWWSEDLVNWHFVACMEAEMDKWAPATCVVGDTLYLTHSQGGAMFKSDDPKSGKWVRVGKPISWDDPALWYDEDGYVYCYYGCSDVAPLYVVKLDPNSNMKLVEGPVECFYKNQAAHGFENQGNNNENTSGNAWMEGAWVVKYEGKYYFNYAVPGTEFASYADGCYVGEAPMGPFTFCESSPVSYKSTGYLVGAGHGAVFRDLWGNWWKIDTVAVSGHSSWERRVELIPLTYDLNGNQITNVAMLDYPLYVPALGYDNFGEERRPDWNLLSYNAAATASSTLGAPYAPGKAADESIRTWWCAATGDPEEWLMLDLGRLCEVDAVQVNFADEDAMVTTGRNHDYCYNYLVEFSGDGETWHLLADHTGITAAPYEGKDTSHDYYELVSGVGARYLRVTNKGAIPAGGKFALSGLRVFGTSREEAPARVTGVTVSRPTTDERRVTVKWDKAEGAEGYIIRFGYDRRVLNQAWQVWGGDVTSATVRFLNMGVDYWFTVDSYNGGGITPGTGLTRASHTRPAPEGTKPGDPPEEPEANEFVLPDLPVYEMENGTLSGGAVKSSAAEDAPASGKATVHNMHLSGAFVEITEVDGGKGGSATLHLGYANGNSHATLEVIVNGVSQGKFNLKSSGAWNKYTVADIPVGGLTQGATNVIRFLGGIDEGFNPDFFQIVAN